MNQLELSTAARLAAEINIIKEQTARQVLSASIEIGERLEQAKALVDHGEWEVWLRDNVSYSQSTAQNLMRIAREYGSNQIDITTGRAPSEIFGNLTYSQAVALFALPEAERIEFIDNHEVTEMSTRELQAAIAEERAAREAAERASLEAQQAQAINERTVERLRERISHLTDEKEKAQSEAEKVVEGAAKAEKKAHKEKQRADALETQRAALEAQIKELREQPPELTEEQRAEIEQQIEKKYADRINQLTIDADAARSRQAEIAEEKAVLERRIQQESDKELVRFQALFERLQMDFATLLELADNIGGERGKKLRGVLASLTDGVAGGGI